MKMRISFLLLLFVFVDNKSRLVLHFENVASTTIQVEAFTTLSPSSSSFQHSLLKKKERQQKQQQQRRRILIQQASYFSTHLYHSSPIKHGDEHETTTNSDNNVDSARPTTTTLTMESSDFLDNGKIFDELLDDIELSKAIQFLRENRNSIEITPGRFKKIFNTIEIRTTNGAAEEEYNNMTVSSTASGFPPISPSRREMTDMYNLLASSSSQSPLLSTSTNNNKQQQKQQLQLFGAANTKNISNIPASGSHIITPTLLEDVTDLSMSSLTPKPTNILLLSGGVLMFMEVLFSIQTGIDLNFLVFSTLLLALLDRILINGTIFESILKIFMPQIQNKILKHEAGHFLCAYLLGCPVEGCVLSAWDALSDSRFGTRVSAGTSFFDPILSNELTGKSVRITQSSIDRYSIIVMGGIAAEAIHFGEADGGAGDEAALVTFLAQLNSNNNSNNNSKGTTSWNEASIKNQARWGALQAVLLLKHYKPCYDALVDSLERSNSNNNLGDCIYAIEEAARIHNLKPLTEPLGYILDNGEYGEWTTIKPDDDDDMVFGPYTSAIIKEQQAKEESSQQQEQESTFTNSDDMKEKLQEYKQIMKDKIQNIDEKLNNI